MTQHTCKIDGLNLVYTVDGKEDAPALIMVHGWGFHKGLWDTTTAALKEHYRCIAVDLIGYGDSDIPAGGDYTILTQARRIVALMDALGYEKATLIGHSMGGQIVMCLASQIAPERVEKLVNVDGVSHAQLTPAAERDLWQIRLARRFPIYLAGGRLWCHTRLYARIYCHHWFYDFDSMPVESYRGDRYRLIQPNSHHSVYPSWEAIKSCDLTDSLHKITAPTLTIFGEYDNVVPVEAAQVVANHVPKHELVLIKECGHFPMYEKPEPYFEALTNFLL